MIVLWVVALDVVSISVLFSILLILIALGVTVTQFVLTKHLFYLLKRFTIMSKLKTKKPKLVEIEVEIEVKKPKTPKPKYKYRDVESNR
jgi:hypothetical protein